MSDSTIFKAAVKLPPGQRAAYLDQACGGDGALREEVESLLRAHEDPDTFLHTHPARPPAAAENGPGAERPGSVIGPYKLLEEIGEGGMGTVFHDDVREGDEHLAPRSNRSPRWCSRSSRRRK